MTEKLFTFLFTDIQGSTQLWEKFQEKMGKAVAIHDSLIRTSIQKHNGKVFKTMGDAFFAVFEDTSKALLSSVEIQNLLVKQDWGEVGNIKVRMALHIGEAEERDNDYFGPTLNRVARLLSAGHGGQLLFSQAYYESIAGSLPEGISTKDMGERRLKDLIKPEHIYQAVIKGLEADFPPLKTIDSRPNNLPEFTTTLIGREKELKEIKDLIRREDTSLVTLTGVGGTGKTRLAIQAGADMIDEFEDGVFFVDLVPLKESEFFLSAISEVLDCKEGKDDKIAVVLKRYLKEKHILLILDNFEHIVEAAGILSDLLKACPNLEVLVTSRIPLHLASEHEYIVNPLGLPSSEKHVSIADLEKYSALKLFEQRAKCSKNDFAVTASNIDQVAEICTRLDGLPLAIELAAARVKYFSVKELLDKFGQVLKIAGSRDLPARQQTIRAMIEWSYNLLDGKEKKLLLVLSIFAGSFDEEGAKKVYGEDVFEGLVSFLDKNLIKKLEEAEPARYKMLETIKEFGREVITGKERLAAELRFTSHYCEMMYGKANNVWNERGDYWKRKIKNEMDNILLALELLIKRDEGEAALKLGVEIIEVYGYYHNYSEIVFWGEKIKNMKSVGLAKTLPKAEFLRIYSAYQMSVSKAEHGMVNEAYELFKEHGDPGGMARVLFVRMEINFLENRYQAAFEECEKALALVSSGKDDKTRAKLLNKKAGILSLAGNNLEAIKLSLESLRISDAANDLFGMIESFVDLKIFVSLVEGSSTPEINAFGEKIEKMIENSKHLEMIGEVRISRLYMNKEFQKVIDILEEEIRANDKSQSVRKNALNAALLSNCYTGIGQFNIARSWAVKAYNAVASLNLNRAKLNAIFLFVHIDSESGFNKKAAILLGFVSNEYQKMGVMQNLNLGLYQSVKKALVEETYNKYYNKGKEYSIDKALELALMDKEVD